MFRGLLFAVLLCLSFEMSGLAAVLGDPACSDDCPADVSGGQCAPNCNSCSCCSLPRVIKPNAPAVLPVPIALRADFVTTAARPSSPPPGEIVHVPKPRLA